MSLSKSKLLLYITGLGLAAILALGIRQGLRPDEQSQVNSPARLPVPVEVAGIETGPIERRRSFSATLESQAEFVVAPKIGGRIKQLDRDLSDQVERGEVVALLDDAEHVQSVASARAELEVARASHAEAQSLLVVAERELERFDKLSGRVASSESQRDLAKGEQLAKRAQLQVAAARIVQAEAALEAARIRLGYTRVTADWHGGGESRVVAERYVDEGETVAANAPLLRIVELDPIIAVLQVTERDYAGLRQGQVALLQTDAFPGETFTGVIQRIAPVFRISTRQARVELRIDNSTWRLKPGMFARASLVLDRIEQAVIVPEQALLERDGNLGVFSVEVDGTSVTWHQVQTGIQQGGRVQVLKSDLSGPVVVLGQQLLSDGARIRIVNASAQSEP